MFFCKTRTVFTILVLCCMTQLSSFAQNGFGFSKTQWIGFQISEIKNSYGKKTEHFDFSKEIGGEDSLEGLNRSMFEVNDFFIWWLLRPVGTIYCTILPSPVIKAIGRCTDNVEFPRRALSALLQGKFKSSGISSLRFLINTVSCAGFFDPAKHWFDLEKQEEDFGQAFASWGIGSGAYLFLPGEGPSNVRDAIGKIFDHATDPKTYIPVPGLKAFSHMNQAARGFSAYAALRKSSADPYKLIRDLGNAKRHLQIRDFDRLSEIERVQKYEKEQRMLNAFEQERLEEQKALDAIEKMAKLKLCEELNAIDPSGDTPQGCRIDTLKSEMFDIQHGGEELWNYLSLFNNDFINQGEVREIALIKGKEDMPYKFWEQTDSPNPPLAVILPGLGGHFTGNMPNALGELLHRNGYAVMILNSAMCFEFMRSASSSNYPGFTPYDVKDVRKAVAAAVKDLEENEKLKFKRKVMVGFSLGALHTLAVAALEKEQNTLNIDRYLALHPPVDLLYSLRQLDKFFNVWQKWDREEILHRGLKAAGIYLAMARRKYEWKGYKRKGKLLPPPVKLNARKSDIEKQKRLNTAVDTRYMINIGNAEAELLIGYSFKHTLEEILVTAHKVEDLGILKTPYSWSNRAKLYREIAKISYYDYATKFLVKYVSRREKKPLTLEQLTRRAGIYAISDAIKDDPKVRIIHSADDIIVNTDQLRYLKKTFGEKAIFFTHGGHLGNLYLKDVHDCILGLLDAEESTEEIIRKALAASDEKTNKPENN